MNKEQLFKQYCSKLVLEGVIKALILGFIVGFAASIIPAFIATLNNVNGIWFSIVIGLAAVAISTPIFYFVKFRPNVKKAAERIDRLGLDERMITMLELENDESYIAMRQREDAQTKLGTINSKHLRVSLFVGPIIAFALFAVCSVAMMTVSATSVDPLKPWEKPDDWVAPKQNYISVIYAAELNEEDPADMYYGGYIIGEADQLVVAGQRTTVVCAVPDFGYGFMGWTDGIKTAERTDMFMTDTEVYARFVKMEDFDSSGESSSGDADSEKNKEDNAQPPEVDERLRPENQVIDGDTYYRDKYQEYYEAAMQTLLDNGDIPADLREFIEAYFKIIMA